MDTVSHGLWAYLLLRRHPKRWFTVLGSVFPDIFIIGTAGVMLLKGQIKVMLPWFPQLYSWPITHVLDTVSHSLIIWLIILGASFLARWNALRWFIYGVFFHIGLDIITHKSYIPKYLWPWNVSTISGIIEYRTVWFTIVNILMLLAFILLKYRRRRVI